MGDAVKIYSRAALTAIALGIIAVLLAFLFLALTWEHTNNRVTSNQRHSDQRWCTLLEQIKFPRQTPSGERFNAALTQLEQEFGCHGT